MVSREDEGYLHPLLVVYMSLVIHLIGQRSRDVIGRLSVSRDVIGCEDYKK